MIPEGEYGGGTVMVWDRGTYAPEEDNAAAAYRRGALKFSLRGRKLKGSWALVRMPRADRAWLLIKQRDAHASKDDLTVAAPRSVVTRRLLADIARDGGGDVEKASTGDPPQRRARP